MFLLIWAILVAVFLFWITHGIIAYLTPMMLVYLGWWWHRGWVEIHGPPSKPKTVPLQEIPMGPDLRMVYSAKPEGIAEDEPF